MKAALAIACTFELARLCAQTPIRVEVDLVRVPCVVTDQNGALITDLKREDFSILDNGSPEEVKYLWRESEAPLLFGLVADVSGSQNAFVRRHQQTLHQFLSTVLGTEDRAFLVSIMNQQRLAADLTQSADALREGIETLRSFDNPILGDPCSGAGSGSDSKPRHGARRKVRARGNRGVPCGGTALWNGVYYSARLRLQGQPGRKALLLLTDGIDTGSDHGLTDAIEACQAADTMVYGILYSASPYLVGVLNPLGAPLAIPLLRAHVARGKRDVERIALETGGATFPGKQVSLQNIFARIQDELRNQYVLAFQAGTHTPGAHKIEVRVTRPGLRVRARQWYAQ